MPTVLFIGGPLDREHVALDQPLPLVYRYAKPRVSNTADTPVWDWQFDVEIITYTHRRIASTRLWQVGDCYAEVTLTDDAALAKLHAYLIDKWIAESGHQ